MKLNHLGITVNDVIAASEFLEEYFGLISVGKKHLNLSHLQDENGLILSIFKGKKITEPETTHIGFIQESEAKVDEMYQCLTGNGFKIDPPQRSHGYTFWFVAPGGFAVEVVC
jgi:lactoylglutathione lyase